MAYSLREPVASGADAGSQSGGPPARLYLTEPARGLAGLAALPLAAGWLASAPRGDGHGVLVLPGLLASDMSTTLLRRYLSWLGYNVCGWQLGRNVGPTDKVLAELPRVLADLARRTGGPVSIIGWSLGGIYARELAREQPVLVREVITLGSPFRLTDPRQSRADGSYRRRSHLHATGHPIPTAEQVARPLEIPSTAVYSRQDGIVSWRTCVEPETTLHENVEVRCAHLGFGVDPATLWVIADRLAAPAGARRPFRVPASLRTLYPRQARIDADAKE